jgi:ligand-binding sensor domain-containing protein
LGPPAALHQTEAEWLATIQRMKKIDDDLDLQLISLDAAQLAKWLHQNGQMPEHGFAIETAKADIKEFPAGPVSGFYHDMTVTDGKAWIADYFGNQLHGVHLESGAVTSFDIPVDVPKGKPGGAHQIDITRDGSLWMTFTKSNEVIHFDTKTQEFHVFGGFEPGSNVQYFVVDVDRYIYEDDGGGIWVTHFSREILSRLDPKTGEVDAFETPRTEHLPENGVHLYAAVADSGGRIWYTETHGNRLGRLDPSTRQAVEREMPEPLVGPKRLAIDPEDRLWIPELTTGKIRVYDTKADAFVDEVQLPIPGDFPYGIRRNPFTGKLWVTGSGSDSLYELDPETKQFKVYRLPRAGAYTRTVSFTEDGDVWTCYASFPNAHTQSPYEAGVVVRLRPL